MQRIFHYIFLVVLLAACRPSVIVKTEEALYPMKKDTVGIDSAVYKLIQPYKATVDATMDKVLINSQIAFPAPDRKVVPCESLLGNLLADIFYQTAQDAYKPADGKGIDFVLVNTGGVRTSLPMGPITTRNVFEVLPFDNRLAVVTISGDSCQSLLNYLAKINAFYYSKMQLSYKLILLRNFIFLDYIIYLPFLFGILCFGLRPKITFNI